MNFKERLQQAATKFDGHVTNGSIEAQMELVIELLREIKSALKTAGDFGEFNRFGTGGDKEIYPETVAIEIIKGVVEKHGIEL
jgi:hypothetical protein